MTPNNLRSVQVKFPTYYFGYERIPRKSPLYFAERYRHGAQNGTQVFFWIASGHVKYGTVQSTSRLAKVGFSL